MLTECRAAPGQLRKGRSGLPWMRRRGFCCTCDIPGEKDPKDQGIREKGLDGAQQKQPENVQSSSAPRLLRKTQRCATESSPRAHSSTAFIQKRRFLSSLRKNQTRWDQSTQQHKQRAPFQHSHHQNLTPTWLVSPQDLEPRAQTVLHGPLAAFPGQILG